MRTKLALAAALAILSLALFGSPAAAQYPPATTTTVATTDTTAATTTLAVSPGQAAPVEDGTLARTGSDTNRFVLVGGVLLAVGAFALVASKRRRHTLA